MGPNAGAERLSVHGPVAAARIQFVTHTAIIAKSLTARRQCADRNAVAIQHGMADALVRAGQQNEIGLHVDAGRVTKCARGKRQYSRASRHADIIVCARTELVEDKYAVSHRAAKRFRRSVATPQMYVRQLQPGAVEIEINKILKRALPRTAGQRVVSERPAVQFKQLHAVMPDAVQSPQRVRDVPGAC